MLKYMTQSSCLFSSISLAILNQLNHWLNMTWTKFLFLPLDYFEQDTFRTVLLGW